jgi:phosphoribosyl-ATP pyrophosphohydrolase/phosphoribosyl-AMP cyclohydrolase/histidinol dehydrogenase
VDEQTLREAALMVDDVRKRGDAALREHGQRLGDIQPGEPALLSIDELRRAVVDDDTRRLLERTAARIRRFARAQRDALRDVTIDIPGGQAGHVFHPLERAGCYAPGGRYPLPSSVLMTAITARVAGVEQVVVASPRPDPVTRAAAAIAGADALLTVGGAQAIAALAYGTETIPRCDIVVGPGNKWVTAAKQLVSADVAIDMLAGPSELLIIADESADPEWIAADLLAQAEHDPDALPMLITTHEPLIAAVDAAIDRRLVDLPTANVATRAIGNGFAVVADIDAALRLGAALGPEHLQIMTTGADQLAQRARNYGTVFIGAHSAEVFGDYGAGPNHVLPTGGTARHAAGLSVLTFLRPRTFLRIDDPAAAEALIADATALARLEALEAHARAAKRR